MLLGLLMACNDTPREAGSRPGPSPREHAAAVVPEASSPREHAAAVVPEASSPREHAAVVVPEASSQGARVAPSVEAVVDLEGALTDPLGPTAAAVTVLVFVSTQCPISNRYAPSLRALADRWRRGGVATWLVYPDPDDDAAAIRAHQRQYALSLPTVRDPGHALVARAGVRVTPEAAVFERGVVAPAYRGRIDDRVAERGKVRAQAARHDLPDAVDAVLAGDPPVAAPTAAIGCYISDLR